MPEDRPGSVWISHSSLSQFRRCPRAYFLSYLFRNSNRNKIGVLSPALSLGSAVHNVIESRSELPIAERFKESMLVQFDKIWKSKYSGEQGGFHSSSYESTLHDRGEAMLKTVMDNPGPLLKLAIKVRGYGSLPDLPRYYISEEDDLLLCGKIDWVEYDPDTDSVKLLDFKTGSGREDSESLQLPIYHLLVHNLQKRDVTGAYYWYLEQSPTPEEKELPDLEEARAKVLAEGMKLKTARKLNHFKCPEGEAGCKYCQPLERVARGEGKFIYNADGRDNFLLSYEEETTATDEEPF